MIFCTVERLCSAPLAQLAEHTVYIRAVVGSNPTWGTEEGIQMDEETAVFAKVAEPLDDDWLYYYAEVRRGVFCVFEVKTLKPIKYCDSANAAKFWAVRYQTGTHED